MSATARHCPVVGFQISGDKIAPTSLKNCPELLPPTIITSPFGRMTEFENERAFAIGEVAVTTGVEPLKSTVKALFTTVPLSIACKPPATTTLPGAYIAHAPCFG